MPRSRTFEDFRSVFRLKELGLSDRAISAHTGVPVNTIRTWRSGRVPIYARPHIASQISPVHAKAPRPEELPASTYAYLLGVYLGDGCLTANGSPWSLRVILDVAYPGIIHECCDAIERISGKKTAPRPDTRRKRCVHIESTWHPWRELFPQHGPGRKHTRRIVLAEWQKAIVSALPKPLLRGLIQTDGWRGLNRVRAKGRDYAYPRYQFSNRSDDIRQIFTDACDRLGIEWRQWTRYHVSIARSASVAFMDTFVGSKS